MSEYDDSHMLSKTLERIAAQAKHLKEKIDLGLEIPSWAEYKVYSAYDGIGKALGTSYPGSYGEAKKEASGYLSKGLGGAAAGALTGAGAGALSDKDNRLRGAAIGAAGGGVLGAGAGLITGKMLKAQRAAIAEGTATESDSLKKVYNALDSRAAPASLVSGVGGGLIGTQMAADYRDKNRARFRKEAGVHVGGGGLQTAATKADPQENGQAGGDQSARRRRNILLGSAGALGALGLGALGLRTLKRGLPNQMPNQMPNLNPSTIQSASAIPQEVKAQFVQQQLQKHMDDYTRYEMGLKAIEHDLSPEEVQQAIREATGGRESEIRHAAPTLVLFDDRWMWRKGELEPLVNDSLKKMGHPPLAPGSSMVDGRACDFTRDCARDIANKRFPSPIDSPFTGKTASATATKTDPQK